jgi:hypothetical protein
MALGYSDSARGRPPFRDDVARGDDASSGFDTVRLLAFAKGDLNADEDVCDATRARCNQIEVGGGVDSRDRTADGVSTYTGGIATSMPRTQRAVCPSCSLRDPSACG